MNKKWRIIFYRDSNKHDRYASCFVWDKTENAAIAYCKNYFHLDDSVFLSAEEAL